MTSFLIETIHFEMLTFDIVIYFIFNHLFLRKNHLKIHNNTYYLAFIQFKHCYFMSVHKMYPINYEQL